MSHKTRLKQSFLLRRTVLLLLMLLSAGCSSPLPEQISQQVDQLFPSIVDARPSNTPFQPINPTATQTITPSPTPEPIRELSIWVEPSLPTALRAGLRLPEDTRLAESADTANLVAGAMRSGNDMKVTWIYALVAPFPTIIDNVPLDEIQRAWRGEEGQTFNANLMLSASTRAAFEARWGPAQGSRLDVLAEEDLLDAAWNNRTAWALIPFEQIETRWKVLRVDNVSPLAPVLNLEEYPLSVWFGVSGGPEALRLLEERIAMADQIATATPTPDAPVNANRSAGLFPPSNRDPSKMTVLVMTGVTALTRATGHKMDTIGLTFPGQDIADWLRFADFTHISNEVSFNTECPKQNPVDTNTLFCSRPEYIGLLEYIGADIIELSGNHNNDWGRKANRFSLEEYRKRGWTYFAGGENLEEARDPARIEHNGNRLAFIGCNSVGPTGAWATSDQAGAAPCGDMVWLLDRIGALREEGYLPIVTFQYAESYVFRPTSGQVEAFRAAAEAGAVIVSGSQAHFPQSMEFQGDAFIHYGLGNLFFDQMDSPVVGTRREFIDRHTFYDGRHIQTELLTAMLEDYARPRPMNEAERQSFLTDIFGASEW